MQRQALKLQTVLNFVKSQRSATLATASLDGIPEAATVVMSEADDFKLVFGCYGTARKYRNLTRNPKVAVVFSQGKISVQLEGLAAEVGGIEAKKLQEIHIAKYAGSAKYLSHPAEKFFLITPTWARYMDHTAKPYKQFELTF